MQPPPDDTLVIQTILQGQQQAYAILVNRYQAYVFTLVRRYVDDRELAEELSQDVFVKAYRCLADFNGSSKFSTWLYTIVNTTCLSHLRKKKDRSILMEQNRLLSISDETHSHDDIQQGIALKAKREALAKAINYLQPEDAYIITLFYRLEQSVEEIGKVLGISSSNVKVKLFRARQKLREILETKFINELR